MRKPKKKYNQPKETAASNHGAKQQPCPSNLSVLKGFALDAFTSGPWGAENGRRRTSSSVRGGGERSERLGPVVAVELP